MICELQVTALGGLGDGIARMADGQVVLVAGGVPGDVVQAELTGKRRGVLRGRMVAMVRGGPDRVEPPCPAFGRCGGCDLQHLTYPAQLAHKAAQLQRLVGKALPVRAHGVEPNGHRRRSRFHLRRAAGRLQCGFLAKQSDELAATPACLTLHPALESLRLRAAEVLEPFVEIGELQAVCGRDGTVALLSFRPRAAPPTGEELAKALQVEGLRCVWPGGRAGWGWADVALPEIPSPWEVRCAADGFCQASSAANAAIRAAVSAALDGLGAPAQALELYAGSGNFTDLLLGRGAAVTAVERQPAACAQLATSAAAAGWAAQLRVVEDEVAAALRRPPPADLWLLDPGREGAAEVAAAAAVFRPPALVYVSCALDTLGRDHRALLAAGYRAVFAQLIDGFPHTVHAESVVAYQHFAGPAAI